MWKEDVIDLNVSRFSEMSARVVLSLLIVSILMAILACIRIIAVRFSPRRFREEL